ncbi:uncharacterized protein PAC_13576 [Phialocephala subalpina]|uniref:Transcription factor domain-containing protein n=1 Tax=Phialocephala subalpina TaxID=576137 RepID=A0A1L7XF58_9HELO|nr:uncharacterized protein PAC_13576 [Phialocephala subalpina]
MQHSAPSDGVGAQLPQGRHAAPRDDDLRQRVARLEKLLAQSNASVGLTPPEDDASIKTPNTQLSISEEVVGIRDLLDNLLENEPNESTETSGRTPVRASICFFSQLVDIYLYRVDPVFKVTHAPSLRATLADAFMKKNVFNYSIQTNPTCVPSSGWLLKFHFRDVVAYHNQSDGLAGICHLLGILDLQAAFDRGSYSAFASGVMLRIPPVHINDSDISPDALAPQLERNTFSGMNFACATYEMLRQMRRLIHTPLDSDGCPLQDMQLDWTQRYDVVDDCARALNDKYLRYCNTNDTFQCFTKVVCNAMVVTLRLLVRRPMYRSYKLDPPPNDDFDVPDTATEILEKSLHKMENNIFKSWEWFAWIKWYAVAIVFAELCEHTEGPVERAWVVAEASFAKYKTLIHDPTLWCSLEKLRRKAQPARSAKVSIMDCGDICGTHINAPLEPGKLPTHTISPDWTFTKTDYDSSDQRDSSWMFWTNWESFVQDLGDPVQLNLGNGFY